MEAWKTMCCVLFPLCSLKAGHGDAGEQGGTAFLPRTSRPSLHTHLCPVGSVNSPSLCAPFPPGVVLRAAPVWLWTRSFNPSLTGRNRKKNPRNPLLSVQRAPWWAGVLGEGRTEKVRRPSEQRRRHGARFADGGQRNLRHSLLRSYALLSSLALDK